MSKTQSQSPSNPKIVFLIDGMGALISSFFLGLVLVQLQSYIGMPIRVLLLLAAIALIFAFYSLVCYYSNFKNWKHYIKVIAIANSLYCSLTIGLMIFFYQYLTLLGLSYFGIEIIIVTLVIRMEVLVLTDSPKNR